jgi:diaminopimelate epimerase
MKTYLYSPGGNPTLLIEDLKRQILELERQKICQKLLKTGECEQVAFIEQTKAGLFKCQMMGNELCINALRSVGAWVYQTRKRTKFKLASSGTSDLFQITITPTDQNNPDVEIKIPLNYKLTKLSNTITLIELNGIAHFLSPNLNPTESQLKKLIQKYPITKTFPAVGLINYQQKNEITYKITPLIFVKETNSYILETACGSGSIAVLLNQNKAKLNIIQPSKSIYKLRKNQQYIWLSSKVLYQSTNL